MPRPHITAYEKGCCAGEISRYDEEETNGYQDYRYLLTFAALVDGGVAAMAMAVRPLDV